MLLNWTTIDACFLFPTLQIRSSLGFFAACLGSFLLVLCLEFLRRLQRQFDVYLLAKTKFLSERGYAEPEEMEEKLLTSERDEGDAEERQKGGSWRKRVRARVVLEQTARGAIHMAQFAVSYCIMLLFMYSNGKEANIHHDLVFLSSRGEYVRLMASRIHHNFNSVWHTCRLRLVYKRHAIPAR